MPEEILVSSGLRIGATMMGTVKFLSGRREQRVSAPITLLSANRLRVGTDDEREIVSAVTEAGQTNFLVTAGQPRKAVVWRREAQLVRAGTLLQELTSILRPLATDGDDIAGTLQSLFDFVAEQRERNQPLRRFTSKQTPAPEAIHVLKR